jgi:hypothetical protein
MRELESDCSKEPQLATTAAGSSRSMQILWGGMQMPPAPVLAARRPRQL